MKTLTSFSLLGILLFMAIGVSAQGPNISVAEKVMNLGKLKQGDPATYDLKVTNTGDEPLIISTVKTSCGCDVASYPKEPIKPGKSVVIKYKYDSNRLGPINKSMTITSNDPDEPYVVVRSKGNVTKVVEKLTPENPVE